MQDTSRLIINHIRIMIEEAERTKTEIKVGVAIYSFVIGYFSISLLLHMVIIGC